MLFFVFLALFGCLFVLERVLHAVGVLLWSLRFRRKADVRVYSMAVLVAGVLQWLWNIFFGCFVVLASFVSGVTARLQTLVIIVAFGVLVTYLYELQGDTLLDVIDVWNGGTGSVVRDLVMVPLSLLSVAIRAVLPLYNAVVWLAAQSVRVIVFGVEADVSSFLAFLGALADAVRALVFSFVGYVHTMRSCSAGLSGAGLSGAGLSGAGLSGANATRFINLTDTTCFEPGLRQFDLLTPLRHLGVSFGYLAAFLSSNCSPLAGAIQALLYPFTDASFQRGAHNLFNALAYTVFQLPLVTWERAKFSSGRGFERILRMPDVNPSFEFAVTGIRGMGRGLDNWLDVVALTVRALFDSGLARAASCAPTVLDQDLPGVDEAVFGANETKLVALTNGMYAITDGWSVQYVKHAGAVERHTALGAWPLAVDVRLGIAAVRYSVADEGDGVGTAADGQGTTAMLGCRCDDFADPTTFLGTRMQLMCAVLPYSDAAAQRFSDYLVPTSFEVGSTAGFANCNMMTFSVQSVRWPLTRVATPDAAGGSAALANSRNPFAQAGVADRADPQVLDAAVWATPRCDVSGAVSNYLCTPGFVGSSCWPWCMAGRSAASGNTALVFYSAQSWDENVMLLHRYCDAAATVYSADGLGNRTASVVFPSGGVEGAGLSESTEPIDACEYQREAATLASKARVPTYMDTQRYTSSRLPDQPYLFAGDAALFVDEEAQELYVRRIYAEDNWQFTVQELPRRVPVNSACRTESSCKAAGLWDPAKVTVAPFFGSSPGVATAAAATRWSVFYAVNPDADVFSQFFTYCRLIALNVGGSVGTQFENQGAYNAPRLWRIDAFAADLGLADSFSSSGGGRSLPAMVEFEGLSGRRSPVTCPQPVNMSIVSVSYVNERNVAVTLLEASPAYFNPRTNRAYPNAPPNTTQVRYVIYYLDPLTMLLQRHRLWQDAPSLNPAAQDGLLCPEHRTMPRLGSFLAEAAVAGVEGARMPVNALFSFPVLLELDTLAEVRRCPVVTRGHSLLVECGVYMFSLDRYFEALVNANVMFWGILSYVSAALSETPQARSTRVLLNGAGVYFTQTANVVSARLRTRAFGAFAGIVTGSLEAGGEELSMRSGVAGFATSLVGRFQGGPLARWVDSNRVTGAAGLFTKLPATMTKLGGGMVSVASAWSGKAAQSGSLVQGALYGPLRWALSGVAGSLGFSWWVYSNAVALALDLLGAPAAGARELSPLDKIWARVYDARAEFRLRVTHEHEKTCTGLLMLFGGSGAVGETVQSLCLMQAYFVEGLLEVVSVLAVDYVMIDCMCGAPAGAELVPYVRDVCMAVAPREYVPVVSTALSQGLASGSPQAVCVSMTGAANDRLYHAFDMFFAAFFDAAEAVQGVVGQILLWSGISVGTCGDFYVNPYLVTVMPQPSSYWQVCGNTSVCRLKCNDLLTAFEQSKALSDSSGTKVSEFLTVVEKPFVTNDDVVANRGNPPYRVLAVVEHDDCTELCGADSRTPVDGVVRDARCFSTAGVNQFEQLQVDGYCVPGQFGVSLQHVVDWTVSRSDEWVPDLVDVYFAASFVRRRDISGELDIPLVVVRRDGVYVYSRVGFVQRLVRAMSDEIYDTSDASAVHRVYEVIVVPGALPDGIANTFAETPADVIIYAGTWTQNTAMESAETDTCRGYRFLASNFLYSSRVSVRECARDNPASGVLQLGTLTARQQRLPVFYGPALDQVLFVPLTDEADLVLCDFAFTSSSVSRCVHSTQVKNALLSAGIEGAVSKYSGLATTSAGASVRRSTAVSPTCFLAVQDARSGKTVDNYAIFTTAFSSGMWISELRVAVDQGSREPTAISKRVSSMQPLTTLVARECSVNTCSACNTVNTQKLCYAASQCVVAKCIGTPVNFRSPACAWGGLVKEAMELSAANAVSLWYAVYEVAALVVDSETGVLGDSVSITFPTEFVNIVACQFKDLVVTLIASVTSIITTALFNKRQVSLMVQLSPEAANDFFAQTTMMLAAITNLFAHVLYFPLYNLFAAVQALTCGVNDVAMIFDSLGKTVRIGSTQSLQAFGDVAGECVSVIVGEQMDEVATSADARSAASAYTSDVMQSTAAIYVSRTQWTTLAAYARKPVSAIVKVGVAAPIRALGLVGKGVLKASLATVRSSSAAGVDASNTKKKPLTAAVRKAASTVANAIAAAARRGGATAASSARFLVATRASQTSRTAPAKSFNSAFGKSRRPGVLGRAMSKIVGARMGSMMQMPVKVVMHWLDAMITWTIGVIRAVQDVIQTADWQHCRLPDASIVDIPTCPCGDFAASIVAERQAEGMADGAFWCSGTLDMVLSDGSSRIVYNPYSLAELKAFSGGLERYLACVASGNSDGNPAGCAALEPQAPLLAEQGISLTSVLTRCRTNYVYKQWDMGAAYLFAPELAESLAGYAVRIGKEFDSSRLPEDAVQCMFFVLENGVGNDACLRSFLRNRSVTEQAYFGYDVIAATAAVSDLALIDACEVFTGPAQRSAEFAKCIDGDDGTGLFVDRSGDASDCEFEYFLWAGRSTNKVPLASPHYKTYDSAADRIRAADQLLDDAQRSIADAFDAMSAWDGSELDITLFTADGDGLHQAMDCMVMGPYAAADLWPAGDASILGRVRYSRTVDAADFSLLSRQLKSPCGVDPSDLEGDMRSPFTCGSPTRKALMKYFVREKLEGDSGIIRQLVVAAVREKLAAMRAQWTGAGVRGCRAVQADGSLSADRSVEYCSTERPDEWTSYLLTIDSHTPISGDNLLAGLMDELKTFVETDVVLNTADVVTRYYNSSSASTADIEWSVDEALVAASFSMFDPLQATVAYSDAESNQPLRSSLWEMCTAHVSQFIATMPMTKDAGGWKLSTLFSAGEYDPAGPADFDNFANAIETYTAALLADSDLKSPLLWSYVMRFVPSDSMVCRRAPARYAPAEASAPEVPFGAASIPSPLADIFLEAAEAAGFPSESTNVLLRQFGFGTGALGEIHGGGACVCDWQVGAYKTRCQIPDLVCNLVASAAASSDVPTDAIASVCATDDNAYAYDDEAVLLQLHAFLDAFAGDVFNEASEVRCDSMRLSDRWGVKVSNHASAASSPVDVFDLLRHGRGGVRIGNLHQHARDWHRTLHPARRLVPLVTNLARNESVAQRMCDSEARAWVASHRNFLVDRYVDELFPVAQTLKTSAPLAYCTRFAIELARWHVLLLLQELVGERDIAAVQEQVVQSWRESCRRQLGVVAGCQLRGVYQLVPDRAARPSPLCPFTVQDSTYSDWYVTANCLVYTRRTDRFFDYCACSSCDDAQQRVVVVTVAEVEQCPVPVDIRLLMKPFTEYNAGLHWARAWDWLADYGVESSVVDAVNDVLRREFSSDVPEPLDGSLFLGNLLRGDGDRSFNANADWRTDEGLYNARHCDALFDWWPEDWSEPVGYHVTAPPFADEAGYRSFDNSFVVDRGNGVFIRYEHSLARNVTLAQNFFGAGGYCGLHSYGMPMTEMNTMRVCTQVDRSTHADPTVPVYATPFGGEGFAGWPDECSDDSLFVPWDRDDNVLVQHGVGLVNFLGSSWPGNRDLWPPAADSADALRFQLPSVAGFESAVTFGDRCPFTELYKCQTDDDCRRVALPGAADSLVCMKRRSTPGSGGAIDGVCAVAQVQTAAGTLRFDCVNHGGCTGDSMCAGDGRCVRPVVTFLNLLNDTAVEAQVFSQKCDDSTVQARQEMWGASSFEAVPDLLSSSGMCSYRNWFEQSAMLGAFGGTAVCSAAEQRCHVDGSSVGRAYTAGAKENVHESVWKAGMLRVMGTPCDRDYMHLSGFGECHAVGSVAQSAVAGSKQITQGPAPLSRVMQTFAPDFAVSAWFGPGMQAKQPFAFVGVPEPLGDKLMQPTDKTSLFKYCSDVKQCHLQQFTVGSHVVGSRLTFGASDAIRMANTKQALRKVATPVRFTDVFTCGVFGLDTADVTDFSNLQGRCILDPAVNSLFYSVCKTQNMNAVMQACVMQDVRVVNALEQACTLTRPGSNPAQKVPLPFYEPTDIDAVRDMLNRLYTSTFLSGVQTLAQYARVTSCARVLWSLVKDHAAAAAPRYTVNTPTDSVNNVPVNGLYWFDRYAVTEFPFAWWVQCTLMGGIRPAADAIVDCVYWNERFDDLGRDDNTRGRSVLDVLLRFEGGITNESLTAILTSATQPAQGVCAGTIAPVFGGMQSYLYEVYMKVKLLLLQDEAFVTAAQRSCFHRQSYNQRFNRNLYWTDEIRSFLERQSEVPEEFLVNTDFRLVKDEPSALSNQIWQLFCEYIFAGNLAGVPWFEFVQTPLANFVWDDENGVPIARFLYTFVNTNSLLINRIVSRMRALYDVDDCDPVAMNDPDGDRFCLYEAIQDRDPAVEVVNQRLPPDALLRRPYVIGFDDGLSEQELRAASKSWKSPYEWSQDAQGRRYSALDMCANYLNYLSTNNDVPVSFRTNGQKDDCGWPWIEPWAKHALGPGVKWWEMNCTKWREFTPKSVQMEAARENDPARDGVCLHGLTEDPQQVNTMRKNMIVPMGVFATFYKASGSSPETMKSVNTDYYTPRDMPSWLMCPLRNLPVLPGQPDTWKRRADINSGPYDMRLVPDNYQQEWITITRTDPRTGRTTTTTFPRQSTEVYDGLYVFSGFQRRPLFKEPTSDVPVDVLEATARLDAETEAQNSIPGEQLFRLPSRPVSMSLQPHKSVFCCSDGLQTCTAKRCGKFQLGVQLMDGLYTCVDCFSVPTDYCRGRRMCAFGVYVPSSDEDLAYLNMNSFSTDEREPLTIERFVELARLLIAARFKSLGESVNYFHALPDRFAFPFYFERWLDGFTGFNSVLAKQFMDSLSAGLDIATGTQADLSVCALAESEKSLRVDYTQCSNEGGLRDFAQFVDREYRRPAFVAVPPGTAVSWRTSRSQLTSESVYAYAASERRLNDRFAAWVMALDLHCEGANMFSSICRSDSDSAKPLLYNPWAGGDWNAVELCDTPQDLDYGGIRIDVDCNRAQCPNHAARQFSQQQGVSNLAKDPFYVSVPDQCVAKQGQNPKRNLPPKSAANNLCAMTWQDPGRCLYKQGVLGGRLGFDGFVADGARVYNLYAETPPTGRIGKGGILGPGRNPLFSGRDLYRSAFGDATALRVSTDDIGGHYLAFAVHPDGGMLLERMPLGSVVAVSDSDYLTVAHGVATQSSSAGDLAWLDNVEGLFSAEAFAARVPPLAAATTEQLDVHWACPFRRLRYWSAWNRTVAADSRPTHPDARRARVLFAPLNANSFFHPLMAEDSSVWPALRYATANGFCVCSDPLNCRFQNPSSYTGECGFIDTVRALFDRRPRLARDLSPTCTSQLDWPYMGGTLRDGSRLASRAPAVCSIFARLPPFRVRFDSVPRYSGRSAGSTSDAGGDCHVGRLMRKPQLPASVQGDASRCRLHSTQADTMTLLCDGGKFVTVQKEKSAAPEWLVQQQQRVRRRTCASASPLPAFVGPKGAPVPNVSSFGMPFRVSSERFIAADLARVLCRRLNCSSPESAERGFNLSAWTPHEFFETVLRAPQRLFGTANRTTPPFSHAGSAGADFAASPGASATAAADDVLWSTPWVACNVTGFDNMTCRGTVARDAWRNPATRGAACLAALQAENNNDLVMDLEICNLDNALDAFCQKLALMRQQVRTAHCVAAGACYNQYFFYYPGTYSVTNSEFVYNSVRDFYRRKDADVCPATAAQSEIIEQNNALRGRCASSQLEPVVVTLQFIRTVVQRVVRIAYYMLMIVLKLLELIPAVSAAGSADLQGTVDRVFREIQTYFKLIFQEFVDLMNSLGNLALELAKESPWGKKVFDVFYKICNVVNKIIEVMRAAVCPVLELVIKILRGAAEGWDNLAETKIVGVRPLLWLKSINPFKAVAEILKFVWQCDSNALLPCDEINTAVEAQDGTLPVATRCWTQFIASYGDETSLACRPSDTCQAEGGGRVVCAQCPLMPAGISDFACDPIQKVCKCGVPVVERTPCTQHQQCTTDPAANCVFLDSDLTQTFGTVPCSACTTRAMCITTDGSGAGLCACPLQSTPFETCSAASVGANVYIDPTGLCQTTLGSALQLSLEVSSNQRFHADFERLAAIPCRFVEPSRSFCFNVWLSATLVVHHIVALDFFSAVGAGTGPFGNGGRRRRRLLAELDWNDADGLCSRVVPLVREVDDVRAVSASDYLAFRECLKWRAVAVDIIERWNLTRVDSHFLLSWHDLARTLSDFGALAELVSHPAAWLEAARHTHVARVVYSALTACARWLNAYVADFEIDGKPVNETFASALSALASVFLTGDTDYGREVWAAADAQAVRPAAGSWGAPGPRNASSRYIETFAAFAHFADAPLSGLAVASHSAAARDEAQKLAGARRRFENATASALAGTVRRLLQLVTEARPFDLSTWTSRSCPVGAELRDVAETALGVVVRGYDGTAPPPAVPASSLRGALPKVGGAASRRNASGAAVVHSGPLPSTRDWILAGVYWVRGVVDRTWDVRGALSSLVGEAPGTLEKLLKCDIEKVAFCTAYKRTVLHSAVLALLANFVLQTVMRSVGVPFVARAVFWTTPLLVLFYSMEYSPFCFPVLPPCLLDELVSLASTLFPERIGVPNALQVYPGCLQGLPPPPNVSAVENGPRNASCLMSCFDAPHAYVTSEVPLAWWLCELDHRACRTAAGWITRHLNTPYMSVLQRTGVPGRLRDSIYEKLTLISYNDADMITAERFCATITAWYLLPWVFVAGAIVYVLSWGVVLPFVALHGAFRVAVDSILSLHLSLGGIKGLIHNVFVQRDMRRSKHDRGRSFLQRLS